MSWRERIVDIHLKKCEKKEKRLRLIRNIMKWMEAKVGCSRELKHALSRATLRVIKYRLRLSFIKCRINAKKIGL